VHLDVLLGAYAESTELAHTKANEVKTVEEAKAEVKKIWSKVKSRKVYAAEKNVSEIRGGLSPQIGA